MRTTAAGLLLLAGILLQGCRYDLGRTWPDRGLEASLSFPDAALPDTGLHDSLSEGGPFDAGEGTAGQGDATVGIEGPVTCAGACPGCCQAETCVPLASQDPGTCGSAGAACAACPPAPECNTMACVQGVCTLAKVAAGSACTGGLCDASGTCCTGCLSNGQCEPGYNEMACGQWGNPCVACFGGMFCISGSCVYINP